MRQVRFQLGIPESIVNVLPGDREPFGITAALEDSWQSSSNRILVVIEHVDREDIKAKTLLNGPGGCALYNAFKLAKRHLRGFEWDDYSLAFINFNAFKTYDLEGDARTAAETAQAERVLSFVERVKPHKVLVLGDTAASYLMPLRESRDVRKYRGWPTTTDGGPTWFNTVSLHKAYGAKADEVDDEDSESETALDHANLLGYMSRQVAAAIYGDLLYKIDVKPRYRLVDSMELWRKLYKKLRKTKVWACDTETENLNRTGENRILTIQFAFSSAIGYVVPLYHKDTPFTYKQIQTIERDLHNLFNQEHDVLDTDYDCYTVGQNLKFDYMVARLNLGIYVIKRRVWDLMAGEFCLDENAKTLAKYGSPQYGLAQIELNYGSDWYQRIAFSKDERSTLAAQPLSDNVLTYASLDVQIPMAIMEQQKLRAANTLHTNIVGGKPNTTYLKEYERLVVTQLNNMIQLHSSMEQRGTPIDIEYLHLLKRRDGPLQSKAFEIRKQLYATTAARKTNKLLLERSGIPTGSIFGSKHSSWMLKLSKPEHKIALFIDTLGLEPLSVGKSGAPSIDKAFLAHHKAVPEVALFSDLSAVEKLLSTYVTPFLQRLSNNHDFRGTYRLNPSFGFTPVVTGRANSFDPNLQQIPSRGVYAKIIKRMFATINGRLKVKLDFNAHEVRCWSIVSGDRQLGSLFDRGRDLRRLYRKTGKTKYKNLMLTEGDVHIQNVSFFFGIALETIKPVFDKVKNKLGLSAEIGDMRDAVKSIVFGAIYGRSARSIAGQINKTKEYVSDLLKKFFPRFPKASQYLEDAKAMPVKHCFVPNAAGRRRHMYGHLFGIDSMVAAVERRGANSPIQSIASDIGHTAGYLFAIHFEQFFLKFGYTHVFGQWEVKNKTGDLGNIDVMVHDALEGDFPYELCLPAIHIMQWVATTGAMQYYQTHYGLVFTTPLEVEFELGTDGSTLAKWDWHDESLREIFKSGLENHKKRDPSVDVDRALEKIYACRKDKQMTRYLETHYPILEKITNEQLERL